MLKFRRQVQPLYGKISEFTWKNLWALQKPFITKRWLIIYIKCLQDRTTCLIWSFPFIYSMSYQFWFHSQLWFKLPVELASTSAKMFTTCLKFQLLTEGWLANKTKLVDPFCALLRCMLGPSQLWAWAGGQSSQGGEFRSFGLSHSSSLGPCLCFLIFYTASD